MLVNSLLKRFFLYLRRLPLAVKVATLVIRDGGYSRVAIGLKKPGEYLKGKTIVITGAASGIGLALTVKFLNEGARVVGIGRDGCKVMDNGVLRDNKNFTFICYDVSDVSNAGGTVEEIISKFSDVDVLINNAGVINGKQFLDVEENDWDSVYSINSKGLFFFTQEFIRAWCLRPYKSCRKIINVSSQAAFVGATYPYRMSKWDVAGLTRGLALKFGEKGILVNGIAPGIVPTSMQRKYKQQSGNEFCGLNPLNRVVLPEEIAELALFLVGDGANFITGQTIVIDGGFSLN